MGLEVLGSKVIIQNLHTNNNNFTCSPIRALKDILSSTWVLRSRTRMAFLTQGKLNTKQYFRASTQLSFRGTYNYYPVSSGHEFSSIWFCKFRLLAVFITHKNYDYLRSWKELGGLFIYVIKWGNQVYLLREDLEWM